jgi:hypothetical protein
MALVTEARGWLALSDQQQLALRLALVNQIQSEMFDVPVQEAGIIEKLYCSAFGRPYHFLFLADRLIRMKRVIEVLKKEGLCVPQDSFSVPGLAPTWILAGAARVMSPFFEENKLLADEYGPLWQHLQRMVVQQQGTGMIMQAKAERATSANGK